MGTTPPNSPPPFDPANPNDPRYNPRTDPRNDPRFQKEQRKNWERAQRMQADAYRAQSRNARRAQTAAYRAQADINRQQWRMYWRANRRTSIIGPLLLICLGIIFLLIRTGRIPFAVFLPWYSHWWPLLLIGVGVLRLVEWAIDRFRSSADLPSRYTVGGGVVFAVILLILTGIGASGYERHPQVIGFDNEDLQQFLGSKHEEDPPAILRAITATGALSIENPRGEVTLAGTSDDGQVHVSVHKEIFSSSDTQAASRLQSLTPVFSGSNDNLSIRIPALEGGTADLNILVPAGVHVTVNANHGDVHATNFKAPVAVTANNGEVEIAAVSGDVSAHVNHRGRSLTVRSVTGKVDAQGSGDEVNLSDITGPVHVGGDFFGGGHLQHITGPVDYQTGRIHFSLARLDGEVDMDENDTFSASEVAGPMTVDTHSRNITLTRVAGDVRVTNNHGDVEVVSVPPSGTLTIANHNGAVTLTLPQTAKFTVNADTSDGEVSTDFSGIDQNHGSIRGSVNGGGPVIRLTTSHGDISLRKNTEAALPPPPPVPKLTGFGSVPVPSAPMPPVVGTSMSSDARDAAGDARQAARDAKAEAQRAAKKATDEARDAVKDAQEKSREAARLAREAAQQKD